MPPFTFNPCQNGNFFGSFHFGDSSCRHFVDSLRILCVLSSPLTRNWRKLARQNRVRIGAIRLPRSPPRGCPRRHRPGFPKKDRRTHSLCGRRSLLCDTSMVFALVLAISGRPFGSLVLSAPAQLHIDRVRRFLPGEQVCGKVLLLKAQSPV